MKYFIVLVILLFLSISVVNASDNITDDMTSNTLETTPHVEKVVTSTEEQIQKESLNINTTSKEKVIHKKSTLQNTKTDSVPISNYTTLNDTLTSDASTDVTIDIGDNITLEGSIEINSAIKTITINGNQYTINGNIQYQFLVIPSGTTVDINNITITNCKALTGGAINNSGNLTITNSTFNNNQAEQKGGAIYNAAEANITLTGNTFRYNTAPEASAIMNEGNINKLENSLFKDNNPDNFIIENNVITLNSTDGFITVGDFTIITDEDEIHGTENLDQHTISSDYKNLKLILNGTDSKTVNNVFMFKEAKEIDITEYSELVAAIEDATINEYDQYIINLLPGDYNATQTIIWSNSATVILS